MREIDEFKIKNPTERLERTRSLLNQIFNHPEFKLWNIEIDKEMTEVKGEILKAPFVKYGKQKSLIQPAQFKSGELAFVYNEYDERKVFAMLDQIQ